MLKVKAVESKPEKKSRTNARARAGGRGPNKTELAIKLSELLKNDDLEGAVKVWRDGLEATKFVWSQKEQKYVDTGFPDWDVREKMATAIAAYMEGRPIERQLQIRGSFEDLAAAQARINASPEARRLLASMSGVQETGSEKSADVTREV